jgi:hypothetical protein
MMATARVLSCREVSLHLVTVDHGRGKKQVLLVGACRDQTQRPLVVRGAKLEFVDLSKTLAKSIADVLTLEAGLTTDEVFTEVELPPAQDH